MRAHRAVLLTNTEKQVQKNTKATRKALEKIAINVTKFSYIGEQFHNTNCITEENVSSLSPCPSPDTHTLTQRHTHSHKDTYTHTHTYARAHAYTHIHVHARAHVHMHTCTHTYTNLHTHALT